MLGDLSVAHPGGVNVNGPTCIATLSGGFIDLYDPGAAAVVNLEDIASGISQIARFTGQTIATCSVAEHSVTVLSVYDALYPGALQTERQYALLHDGHEAYCGDMTAPMKRALERQAAHELDRAWHAVAPYIERSEREEARRAFEAQADPRLVKTLEHRLEVVVLGALGIPMPDERVASEVKRCDLIARYAEGGAVQDKDDTWVKSSRHEPMPVGARCYWGSDHRGAKMLFLDAAGRVGLHRAEDPV